MIDSVVEVSLVKRRRRNCDCGRRCFGSLWRRKTVVERGSESETNNVACERAGVKVRVLMIIRNVCGL